jgi:hypothetical protein
VEVMLWHWRIALTVLIFSMSAGCAATAGGRGGGGQDRGEGSKPARCRQIASGLHSDIIDPVTVWYRRD